MKKTIEMKDIIKSVAKVILTMLVWVFVLNEEGVVYTFFDWLVNEFLYYTLDMGEDLCSVVGLTTFVGTLRMMWYAVDKMFDLPKRFFKAEE